MKEEIQQISLHINKLVLQNASVLSALDGQSRKEWLKGLIEKVVRAKYKNTGL